MVASAPLGSAPLPSGQLLSLPTRHEWRRAGAMITACLALAVATALQRYWPFLAGEPPARQLALLKAMLVLPVLLSLDRIRGWRPVPDRPPQRTPGR